jgi:phosphoserine phosphatase RsbU/P
MCAAPLKESLLRRVSLFASLPDAELDSLAGSLRERTIPAGTVLLEEGEYGDRFYVILDGRFEIVKARGTGEDRSLGVRGAGEFVGEMSLLNPDGRRTASVRVLSDARVLELTRADFNALLERHPSMVYEMLRVMSARLRESHDSALHDLHEKNERLARAYAELQEAQAQIIEQETLLRELRLAREIQESMLPPSLPRAPGFDIGACMLPAHMVGGDFYDVIPLGPESIGIAVGDVSGKGVPAAMFMALAASLLRAEVRRGAPPEEALALLNHHLLERNAKQMFVTLLFGVLHLATREFRYARAGHEFPLAWDAGGAPIALPSGGGLPLGMFPAPRLDVQSVTLPPGGTLLLYTDGVIDSADETGALFGRERLLASFERRGSGQELCERLLRAIEEHRGPAPQFDDITLVAVRARAV